MDYKTLEAAVSYVYQTRGGCHLPQEDAVAVLWRFLDAYRHFRREEHPDLAYRQILDALGKMGFADEKQALEMSLEYYRVIIPAYFLKTFANGCDYRLSHFFAGKIRENLFYENLY